MAGRKNRKNQLSISSLHKNLIAAQQLYYDMHKKASLRESGIISLDMNENTGKVHAVLHARLDWPKDKHTRIAQCTPIDFPKHDSGISADPTDSKYLMTSGGNRILKSDYYDKLDFGDIIDEILLMNKEFNRVAHKLNPHWQT